MKLGKVTQFATASVCTLALSFTAVGVANAAPATEAETISITTNNNYNVLASDDFSEDENTQAMYQLLNYYANIPDAVLENGDAALQDWQKQNPITTTRASVLGCIGAVAWLIGNNVVGVAKIVKIKRLIKALGGVKNAVKLMWKDSFKIEKMKAAGGALTELGAELLGVSGVKKQCFS